MLIESGSIAFLQQAHRNNWQQYLSSLRGDVPGWNICVLTASDERQAAMYRQQLAWRRDGGLLPKDTRFQVLPDPEGLRIGSGGATLRVLATLARARQLQDHRILVIHSGGDSRRLPHCSATGKLFARLPRPLPDGRASTLFDEFLISLSGLATGVPSGVLVASGDVLLIFDHLQISLQRQGATGVAAAAPSAMGPHHGVYVGDQISSLVRAYLHKPPPADLAKWQAIDEDGTVQIDTGLIWFDRQITEQLVALAEMPSISQLCGLASSRGALSTPGLNLYGDLLLPLAQSTTLSTYYADESEGQPAVELLEARRLIWNRLRGHPFSVERLHPAVFGHFGTSSEYWKMVANDADLALLCGWRPGAAAWVEAPQPSPADCAVLINTMVERLEPCSDTRALILDSDLGSLAWAGASIVASVRTGRRLSLGEDLVIHQLPIDDGFVTRIYGLHDNPKHSWDSREATFLNRPWRVWLDQAQLDASVLWPHASAREQSLWSADLYPVCADRDQSLEWALILQEPQEGPPGWQARWAAMPRLSLAESFQRADTERILQESIETEDKVASRRFLAMIQTETAATEATALLGTAAETIARRSNRVAAMLSQAGDPILALRGYKALETGTGQMRWEDRAFAGLSDMIRTTLINGQDVSAPDRPNSRRESMIVDSVRVQAAARIDLGGGWTDTPPHSIERGGTVLNAALTLHGSYPITATASWLSEPRLILECKDIGATLEPTRVGEVMAYTHPSDPFALPKAALVLQSIVPSSSDPDMQITDLMRSHGRGVYLGTQTSIPRGSGLGTSSILGGAVLASLSQLLGIEISDSALFDRVLVLEQMLTTGGGWQDQVGGLVGGIKLVTSEPGLPQRIQVRPADLASETWQELADRLLLVYTGQQRLAKNLLRAVMGRWMARDPEMVWILGEIARLAQEMWVALQQGNVDALGSLLREHWSLNKAMDPGCTNPFIDDLFESMEPYVLGGKVAGAGGGGFAILIGRDAEAGQRLDAALRQRYPGSRVAVWPCAIPEEGMRTEVKFAPTT